MIMLNKTLQQFHLAACNINDDQRMAYVDGKPTIGAKDAGLLGRDKKVVSGNVTTTQTQQNNDVRTALLTAIKDQFKNKASIPESVLKALKGSSIVGGSDMKTDDNGNVISGRPLTARRIKAVLKAVTEEVMKDAPVDNAPYWKTDISAANMPPKNIGDIIQKRLQKMCDVCPDNNGRFRTVSKRAAESFVNLINIARNKGQYGEAMVSFIMGKILERNHVTTNVSDRQWFQGTVDDDPQHTRLERDIRRFLNVGGAYEDYWNDPETAVEADKVADKAREYDEDNKIDSASLPRKNVEVPEDADTPMPEKSGVVDGADMDDVLDSAPILNPNEVENEVIEDQHAPMPEGIIGVKPGLFVDINKIDD